MIIKLYCGVWVINIVLLWHVVRTQAPADYEGRVHIRLNGGDASSGRVQIKPIDGNVPKVWGSVCDDFWDNSDAIVACRMLTYVWGLASTKWRIDNDATASIPVHLDNVHCRGNESSLIECRRNLWGEHNCGSKENAGVVCSNSSAQLSSYVEAGGTVSLLHGSSFVSVCDGGWDDNDATVVCKELGFVGGRALVSSALGDRISTDVSITNVMCTGSETGLSACPYQLQNVECTYRKRASVLCYTKSAVQDDSFKVRLTNGGKNYGFVEVRHLGVWGNLCDRRASEKTADVVCRQAGFAGGRQIGADYNPDKTKFKWLSRVNCSGSESSLMDCDGGDLFGINFQDCYRGKSLAVFCYSQSDNPDQFKVRLMNGNNVSTMEGRVEMNIDGKWGTLCDVAFASVAKTICKSLGFNDGNAIRHAHFGEGTGPVWLGKYYTCSFAKSLLSCNILNQLMPNSSFCLSHKHDLSVRCFDKLKLLNGGRNSGQVYVYRNGVWGRICGSGWDDKDARVVCRQLGYAFAKSMCCNSFPSSTSSWYSRSPQTLISSVRCNGTETSLDDCPYSSGSSCSYQSRNYASVLCSKSPLSSNFTVHLTNGGQYSDFTGSVQIVTGARNGYICANGWNDTMANIVCKELGFTGGQAMKYFSTKKSDWYQKYIITSVTCQGTEASLKDCQFRYSSSCSSRFGAAGVLCHKSDGIKYSLEGGKADNIGRIIVTYDGIPGTVCRSSFSTVDANVFCKSLDRGYNGGEALYFSSEFGSGSGPVYLTGLQCTGVEDTILQCANSGWRMSNLQSCLTHDSDAGVQCYTNVRMTKVIKVNQTSRLGYPELQLNGEWAPICYNGFDDNDASVICREMLYTYGKALPLSILPPVRFATTSFISNMQCRGAESSTVNCQRQVTSRCLSPNDTLATVVCSQDPIDTGFDILLGQPFGLKTKGYGPVYIKSYNAKAPICSALWDDNAANVACKEFGYMGGRAIFPRYLYSYVTLLGINCTGSETRISQCNIKRYSYHPSCKVNSVYSKNPGSAASVLCYNNAGGVRFRLTGGNGKTYGRVETSRSEVWGSVCSHYLHERQAAKVICKELGFMDGAVYNGTLSGRRSGQVFYSDPLCYGNESSILQCRNKGWQEQAGYCSFPLHDFSVRCTSSVKLELGDSGPVVVYNNQGLSGYICDNSWDDREANVVCRSVGYTGGKAICCSAYGKRSPIIALKIECSGSESNLRQCLIQYGNQRSCGNGHVASVSCFDSPPSGESEVAVLVRPSLLRDGPVKIKLYDRWGKICPNGWDNNDAKVVCRSYGFSHAIAYRSPDTVKGPMWMGNVQCSGSEYELKRCPGFVNKPLGYACPSTDSAAVMCTDFGALSYSFGGTFRNRTYGPIVVKLNNTWGNVCGYSWSNKEAYVYCRNKGYKGGTAMKYNAYHSRNIHIWLRGVKCQGSEEAIENCRHLGWGLSSSYYCPEGLSRYIVAGARCTQEVRLRGVSYSFGILEYWKEVGHENGTWYSFCDIGFTVREATVACKQLGYRSGKAIAGSHFGRIYSKLLSVRCSGSEDKLSQCTMTNTACRSRNYTSIYCSRSSLDKSLPFTTKLTGSRLGYNGKVMARVEGVWGRVCSFGWSDKEATVYCKEKGYAGGHAYGFLMRSRSVPYTMYNVNCTGSETLLNQCVYENPMTSPLSPCTNFGYDAGVLCFLKSAVTVQLIGGSRNYGTVQLSYDGRLGTICDYSWTNYDAKVLCRQLGFVEGIAYRYSRYGKGQGEIFMSGMVCNSYEKNILECRNYGWRQAASYCVQHSRDAGVLCFGKVKFTGGNNIWYGAVSVWAKPNKEKPSWYAVCDESWDDIDARVLCKELGYNNGVAICCGAFGYKYNRAYMTNVRCQGTEKSLLDCQYDRPTDTYCYQRKYASATCFNTPPSSVYSLQITVGSRNYGRLGVRYYNLWGRICADDWDDKDALVACRELGYINGKAYTHYEMSYSSVGGGPFWASNFKCAGHERRLGQCQHTAWGNVHQCSSRHSAGVYCYSNSGIFYRMAGGNKPNLGRVEISVNGIWGSVCDYYWNNRDAGVFCRQMGFTDGAVIRGSKYGQGTGRVWWTELMCSGKETSLDDCPHRSWQNSLKYACDTHSRDVGVHCFGSVRLSNRTSSVNLTSGAVEVYREFAWHPVCDVNFTDVLARQVCEELGFYDGKVVCCSAYGQKYYNTNNTWTIRWNSSQPSVAGSKTINSCDSGKYASVICIPLNTPVSKDYDYSLEPTNKSPGTGSISVSHLGVKGRVCSENWDDVDATVFCKSKNFLYGIAYPHTVIDFYALFSHPNPYLVSKVSCSGSETKLNQCSISDRTDLGDCSSSQYDAGVMCMDDRGLSYRLAGGDEAKGRVEVGVAGVWGTICNTQWDKNDAAVLCRSLGRGFNDGEPVYDSRIFGIGQGPIWLSYLKCKGNEKSLDKCPHPGWNRTIEPIFYGQRICTHNSDAGVFCFKNVRLSLGFQKRYGNVEIFMDGQWGNICDKNWDDSDAKVACQELGFLDGKTVPRSSFGGKKLKIQVSNFGCSGSEKALIRCSHEKTSVCSSNYVAGVYCSNQTITQQGYQIRLSRDVLSSPYHGIIEVNYFGVWGRVCSNDFGDREAKIGCKMLGYAGGNAYTHVMLNEQPIVASNLTCPLGYEKSFKDCNSIMWGDNYTCSHRSFEAGVICSNTSSGIDYRLIGAEPHYGRVEILYDGKWGTICDWNWFYNNAKVMCRQLGYKDGLALSGSYYGGGTGPVWMQWVHCQGTEKTLLQCTNSGWNISAKAPRCLSHKQDASVKCLTSEMKIIKARLVDGNTTSGRVEVYASGVEEWGTICDDNFDTKDAIVICKMLGYESGRVIRNLFGIGTGMILLDNLSCTGKELHIQQCKKRGIGDHNCEHKEDIAVSCSKKSIPVTPPHTTHSEATKYQTSKATRQTTPSLPSDAQPKTGKVTGNKSVLNPAAIAVPVVLIIVVAIIVGAVAFYKYRVAGKPTGNGVPSVTRDSPMQVSNILYDLAIEEAQQQNADSGIAYTTAEFPHFSNFGSHDEPVYAEPSSLGPAITGSDKAELVNYEELPEGATGPPHNYAEPSSETPQPGYENIDYNESNA